MGKLERIELDDTGRNRLAEQAAACLKKIICPGERVLICLPELYYPQMCVIAERAVWAAGGDCTIWEGDLRWKTLMKQLFFYRTKTIIAPPMLAIELSKLSKVTGTPLFIRNVIPAGFPCILWMEEEIRKGLDCNVFRCEYLENTPEYADADPELIQIAQELLTWNSVLDCSLKKGFYGLEMEIIFFPGEKQPKLPSCAKRILKKWDPDTDCPLWWNPYEKNDTENAENH